MICKPIVFEISRPEDLDQYSKSNVNRGGTNLRVAFIEPLGPSPNDLQGESRVERHLEKAWPILEKLKRHNADDLFAWIGRCVVEVVGEGYASWSGELIDPLPVSAAVLASLYCDRNNMMLTLSFGRWE